MRSILSSNKAGLVGLFSLSTFILFAKLASSPNFSKVAWFSTILGMFAAWRWSLKHPIPQGDPRIVFSFLLYTILTFISCIANPETLASYSLVSLWIACFTSGYLVSCLLPDHNYKFVLGALFAIIFGVIIILPISLSFGDLSELFLSYRLQLYTGHPSRLALYCSFCIFYCLYEWQQRRGLTKWLCVIGSGFLFITLYLTNARTLLLLLPPSAIAYIIICKKRQALHFSLAVIVVITLVVGLAIKIRHDPASERLISAITNLKSDDTFRSRLPIWEVGMWAFSQSPLIGNGVRSYYNLHARYENEHRQKWAIKYPGYEKHVTSAHNILLGRLVDTGIIGTIAFFAFYALSLHRAIFISKDDHWIAAFLIFYLLIGVVDDPLKRVNDSFIFFLTGLIAGRPPTEISQNSSMNA